MQEKNAALLSDILARLAAGEITAEMAHARIDRLIMSERIDAAAQGGTLTRKLFHIPAQAPVKVAA